MLISNKLDNIGSVRNLFVLGKSNCGESINRFCSQIGTKAIKVISVSFLNIVSREIHIIQMVRVTALFTLWIIMKPLLHGPFEFVRILETEMFVDVSYD